MTNSINVINIVPKDLYFVIEFPQLQLHYLKLLFDHAHIDYNAQEEPEMLFAIDFMNKTLYPFLEKIEKGELEEI